jgi:1-acyl-sn-glycerol-3-phosphate acyltransferase
MKTFFGRIWAFWGIIWFIGSMLIILPYVIVTRYCKEPFKSTTFYKTSRVWMLLFLYGVGCPVRVRGKENFLENENYIVTSNHNSNLDAPLTSPFIIGTNKTIAKKDFLKVPVFNLVYERGGVLIDRKSDASRRKGYADMKAVLDRGWHMCIYPEGTRNKTNNPLQPFKDGAFRLAIETGKSIMPCLLFNTKKALPQKPSFFFWPTKLEVHFLPAISPIGHTAESLNKKVYEVMEAYYVANNKS